MKVREFNRLMKTRGYQATRRYDGTKFVKGSYVIYAVDNNGGWKLLTVTSDLQEWVDVVTLLERCEFCWRCE